MSSSPSMCDSDAVSESELLSIRELQRENAKLTQINHELNSEIVTLRRQFEQAVTVSTTIDEMVAKSTADKSELNRLKCERDDLAQRLKISFQANQELQMKIESVKVASRTCDKSDGVVSILKQQKSKLEKNINELQGSLDNEKKAKDRMKFELEQLNYQLDPVFQAASAYFDSHVDSPQTLLECFMKPAKESLEVQKLKTRADKLKAKLKKAKKEALQVDKLRQEYQTELNSISTLLEHKTADLTRQVDDLQARNQSQFNQIQALTKEKENLIKENANKTTQARMAAIQCDEKQSREATKISNQLADTTEVLNQKLSEIRSLKKKLYKVTFRSKNLEKKCHAYEGVIRTMEARKKQMKDESERVSKEMGESDARIRTLEGTLERARDEIAAKRKEIERLNDAYATLETEMKQKDRENVELRRDRDLVVEQIQRENIAKQTIENKLQLAHERHLTLEKEIHEVRQQVKDAKKPVDTSELVPASVWASGEFPGELQDLVTDIAKSNCQFSAKLQNCFNVIGKWFRCRCDRLESDIAAEHSNYTTLRNQAEILVDFMKRLMPDVKINFDFLLTDEMTRSLYGDAVRALKNEISVLSKDKAVLEAKISDVCLVLGISGIEEARESFAEREDAISKLARKLKLQKAKSQRQRETFKDKISQLESLLMQADSKINEASRNCEAIGEDRTQLQKDLLEKEQLVKSVTCELQEAVHRAETLESDNMNLNEMINKLRKKKDRLETQLKSIQQMMEELESKYKEKVKNVKESADSRYNQLNEQTRKQVSELQSSLKEQSEKAVRFEAINTELEAKNSELSLKNQRLETKFSAIQMGNDRDRRALESQMNAKMQFAESNMKAEMEEVRSQASAFKSRVVDSVARQFIGLVDGMKINESNIDVALQMIRRKVDAFSARDITLRNIMNLDVHQSIEEAVTSLVNKRRKK